MWRPSIDYSFCVFAEVAETTKRIMFVDARCRNVSQDALKAICARCQYVDVLISHYIISKEVKPAHFQSTQRVAYSDLFPTAPAELAGGESRCEEAAIIREIPSYVNQQRLTKVC